MAVAPPLGLDPPSAGRSTRRAGALLAQRLLDVVRAAIFGAIVPRLLGPEDFGRFGVLASIGFYLALLSGMGTVQLMGRFVPVLRHAGNHAAIARMFAGLLAVRVATGLLCGLGCWLALRMWLSDMSALAIGLTAATVVLRGPANTTFALFLGLDHADRWGAGEVLRRWASLLLVVPGTMWLGLSGALGGVAVAELVVLGVGLYLTRPWLSGFSLPSRDEWQPYARYNAAFFIGNALFAMNQFGAGPLIRAVSGGYEQVAWFAAAHSAYLLAAGSLRQLAMSFAPLFSSLRASGRDDGVVGLAERFVLGVGVIGVIATLAAALIGTEVTRIVLGEQFAPAGPVLPFLAVAIVFGVTGQMGRVLALTWDRPRAALLAALCQVATLFLLGPVLIRQWGAIGGGLTVLASSGVSALYWVASLQDVAPGFGRGLARALGFASPFLLASVLLQNAAAGWRFLALLVLVAAYGVTLARTRILTPGDVLALIDTLRDRPRETRPTDVEATGLS